MLERGGFSFVALLVINPIAILFFQNCSFLPTTQNALASREVNPQKRFMSSLATPKKIENTQLIKVASPTIADCKSSLENCPVSEE
ncbi:MAG TPA: hypothetical protein VIG33_11445 [Pseudobdellovibrionaceae bacterium]|jgi:hypothetical protein